VTTCTQAPRPARNPGGVLKRLPDGALILVRPIRPDDKRMLEEGLRHLSDESVQRRFLTLKRKFSRAELRYLTEVNGRDHVALVAEYPGDQTRRLIAVARFVRLADDPAAAEVAIVVTDEWQRRGIGTALTELLADRAREVGISRFTATIASDNLPALKLMRRLSSRLEGNHVGHGVSEMVLDLAA
jgi:RimJ/RimL family protein N-acetyltransferase